jgi:hypothetical protein
VGGSVNGYGVAGSSTDGDGVYGSTAANGRSGVAGVDGSPDSAYGVSGQSRVGVAVYGVGTSGAYGVQGESSISTGVYGHSPTGYGVQGNSEKGDKTVTVTAAGTRESSIVLATIQKPHSGVAIEGAQAATGKFTITLTVSAPASTTVGWLVIG